MCLFLVQKNHIYSGFGRSFGSKPISRKVSPKVYKYDSSTPNEDENISDNDKINFSKFKNSNQSSSLKRKSESYQFPKEIIIENLNTFSERFEDSNDEICEMTKYLNTFSSNKKEKGKYVSRYYKDNNNGSLRDIIRSNLNDDRFLIEGKSNAQFK